MSRIRLSLTLLASIAMAQASMADEKSGIPDTTPNRERSSKLVTPGDADESLPQFLRRE